MPKTKEPRVVEGKPPDAPSQEHQSSGEKQREVPRIEAKPAFTEWIESVEIAAVPGGNINQKVQWSVTQVTDQYQLKPTIEAALFSSLRLKRSFGVTHLAAVLSAPLKDVEAALKEYAEELESPERVLYLVRKGNVVYVKFKPDHAKFVKVFLRRVALQERRRPNEPEKEVISKVALTPGLTTIEICMITGRNCSKEVVRLRRDGWIRSEQPEPGSRRSRWYVTDEWKFEAQTDPAT
jgi:chromosome segregation and condensation protein ScpB